MSSTYSFLDITASLVGPGGALSMGAGSGAAEEGISVVPNGDFNALLVGADGEAMHSLKGDRSGRITIRLLKTAPLNGALAQMMEFQRASSSLHGQNDFVLADTARGDQITATQVAFQKAPDLNFAGEGGTVEWEFSAGKIFIRLGQG